MRKKINPEELPEAAAFISAAKADNTEPAPKPGPRPDPPTPSPSPRPEPSPKPGPRPEPKIAVKEDLHQYVHRAAWPIFQFTAPSLVLNSTQRKTQNLMARVTDGLFESISRHCAALDVDKSEWMRNAIERQLAEEQQFFEKLAKKRP